MAAIYAADVWCSDCADKIREDIHKAGTAPADPDDEHSYDSDHFPKHADDDEESDSPQHCAAGAECLNYSETSDGEKYGYFFENDLTADGDEYVKETVNENLRDGRMDSPAVELWMPCYSYIDYHKKCECGTYDDLDEDDTCDDCLVCSDCKGIFPCDDIDENDECSDCATTLVYNGCSGDFKPDDLNDDNYCKDCVVDKPVDGDYTITPCGSLGGMSGVGVIGGKFVGEFHSDDEAIMAIRRIMNEEKFWPNIWIVSNHGNQVLYKD